MSDELINHRLKALEEDRAKAAEWREATTAQIAELSATVKTALAVGEQRMDAIDKHLEHTDAVVDEVEGKVSAAHRALQAVTSEVHAVSSDVASITVEAKNDPKAFYTAIGSGIAAIAAGIVAYFKGTP